MRKILHFDSPSGDYQSEACVVSCFDARFELVTRKLLKRLGILNPDHVKIAGAAKWLASPDYECDRDFVMRQIHISMTRHHARRLVLLMHSDCGAYGGLAAFGNDPARELTSQKAELRRAIGFVAAHEPALTTEAYFLNFEGAWEAIEAAQAG